MTHTSNGIPLLRFLKSLFVTLILFLAVNSGCGQKLETKKSDIPTDKSTQKKITKKSNSVTKETPPKRFYRKDAMKVDTFPYFADYNGYRYYFPCGPCRDKFIQEKEKYLENWIKKGRRIRKRKLKE